MESREGLSDTLEAVLRQLSDVAGHLHTKRRPESKERTFQVESCPDNMEPRSINALLPSDEVTFPMLIDADKRLCVRTRSDAEVPASQHAEDILRLISQYKQFLMLTSERRGIYESLLPYLRMNTIETQMNDTGLMVGAFGGGSHEEYDPLA
jgi:hypothetical protein